MKIENNILKHYLKNVYFITGTAYAGKSTTVKMLAERYDMVSAEKTITAPYPILWPQRKRSRIFTSSIAL